MIDLDIINEINQSVEEESKKIDSEKIRKEEDILSKNAQTEQKIAEERSYISNISDKEKGDGLSSKSSAKSSSFFKNGSSTTSTDKFFADEPEEKKTEKKSYYGYSSSSQKEKSENEKSQERARAYTKNLFNQSSKLVQDEMDSERRSVEDYWNIFELHEQKALERKKKKKSKVELNKQRRKDANKKMFYMTLLEISRSMIESLVRR